MARGRGSSCKCEQWGRHSMLPTKQHLHPLPPFWFSNRPPPPHAHPTSPTTAPLSPRLPPPSSCATHHRWRNRYGGPQQRLGGPSFEEREGKGSRSGDRPIGGASCRQRNHPWLPVYPRVPGYAAEAATSRLGKRRIDPRALTWSAGAVTRNSEGHPLNNGVRLE